MSQFEFGPEHDVEFEKAGYWMAQVGLLGLFIGVVQTLVGILSVVGESPEAAFGGILTGVVYVVFGVLLRRSAKAFKAIAASEGQDLDHLMTAVVSLKKLFRIMVVGIVVLFFLAIGFGVLAGMMGSAG